MTATTPDERELAELAYSLSLRTLGQQEAALNELRARTGTLLAAAALVASFLGATAIDRAGLDVLTVLALVALVTSVVLATRVLLPRSGFVFSIRGSVLYEREADTAAGIAETHWRLAHWLEAFHDENEGRIVTLFLFYRLAVAALLAEIACWSLALALS